LFVTDVITSKSTQELGSLIQELQSLEYQIHDNRPISSSSSSSSSISLSPLVLLLLDAGSAKLNSSSQF
ncbi:unnamed protein product, partial [Rotaria socialis]